MPVIDVIRSRAQTYQLIRPGTATLNQGYAVEAAPTIIPTDAHIQPLTPKQIRDLPPGQNATDWRNIWSEQEMRISDRITENGVTFTVKTIEYWEEGQFYHATAVITLDTL